MICGINAADGQTDTENNRDFPTFLKSRPVPVKFGKKHLKHQNWEKWMQSKKLDRHFKWIKKHIRNQQCKAFVALIALHKKTLQICIKM